MIDGHNLSGSYGADYINFLRRVTGGFAKKNIIDIGAGGCLLLELMRQEGANVLGVDPSPVAKMAAESKSIPLINEFFRPGLLKGYEAQLITQMDVFEHVYDPLSLLKAQAEALVDGGVITLNVPNCEYSIENGDISMAIHQHVNMFTRYSLCKLVEKSGLYVSNLEISGYGSALYCAASKNKNDAKFSSLDFSYQKEWLQTFPDLAKKRIRNFTNFYDKKINTTLGVFIFQRALPYFEFNTGYT
jgi:SAM-dependent methyltransferase